MSKIILAAILIATMAHSYDWEDCDCDDVESAVAEMKEAQEEMKEAQRGHYSDMEDLRVQQQTAIDSMQYDNESRKNKKGLRRYE